ncbi:DNA-binding protein [Longibacter salinarum]|uniref:DNA-binding protein n=1 Tax=Longibacter salinarum TaxID=1850348 RepID=A0A2A8D0J2_9BACT|nr:endonuclease [Longibacter salinarum]PEN14482.1 DNA-binding protein [Longibacter salinarum]
MRTQPLLRFLTFLALLVVASTSGTVAQSVVTIAEARSQGVDATVTVEGTVTRAFGSFVRLQDDSGTTGASALVIRQTSGPFNTDVTSGVITAGTQLQVTGTLSEFNGLLQINESDLGDYQVLGQGSVPAPQSVSIDDLASAGEDYESELVSISSLSFQSASGVFANGEDYTVVGETGSFPFRVQQADETQLAGTTIPAGAFEYEGVVGQFINDYQLIPVLESDVQSSRSFRFNRIFANVEEGTGTVSVDVSALNVADGETVSVTVDAGAGSTAEVGTDVTGLTVPQTLTFTDADPAPQSISVNVSDDTETEGLERLELVLSSADGAIAVPGRFTIWIRDDATAQGTVASGETGDILVETLQATFGSAPTLGYDIARDSLYRTIYNDGGIVEGIYTGFQATVDPNGGDASQQAGDDGVNTEHIWPRSQGAEEEPALSDMHILAPAFGSVNSARSNYAYGEIPNTETDTWFFEDQSQSTIPASNIDAWSELDDSPTRTDRRFEPREAVKGDVARAAFYFVTMYPNRANLQFYEQQRETLFQWHQDDPVDAAEVRRNIIQASYQGNKVNPFIVDPTLIDRAYFSGGGSPSPTVISIREARQLGGGATVTVEGTVTRLTDDGPYIQDATAGLYVFESQGAFGSDLGNTIQVGTELCVTGSLEYYNGLLELTDVADGQYEAVSQGNTLPTPPVVTLSDIVSNGEDYEAELVRVEDIQIEANGDATFQASTNYAVTDASLGTPTDAVSMRIPDGSPLVGVEIPVTTTFAGALGQFNGEGFESDEPDTGYQLLGLATSDLQGAGGTIPDETKLDVSLSFGSTGETASYRLVGLAGQVDRSIATTLSGAPEVSWTAFHDTGASQDYLQTYDGSDTFNFRPGRGFWLLSTSDWTVSETVSNVNVSNNTTTVPLHDGWNIISNPLPLDVSWSAVVSANGGSLQPIWQWDGSFQQTASFTAATGGEAFYFLNDQGLTELTIPTGASSTPTTLATHSIDMTRHVELEVTDRSGNVSRIQVGEMKNAHRGIDPYDHVAPPTGFARTALRVQAPGADNKREKYLARDLRAPANGGQTYPLRLLSKDARAVTLGVQSLPAQAGTRVILVNDESGVRHDLTSTSSLSVNPSQTSTSWTLLVGTEAYVSSELNASPDQVVVEPPAPNPFRDATTIRYVLPESKDVKVEVYDLLGRRLHTLVNKRQSAGEHTIRWNGTRGNGASLSSGMYFVRMNLGAVQHVHKVVHVR